ncbi:MAG: rod shape-determining protein MreD [Bacteroidota bacterium]
MPAVLRQIALGVGVVLVQWLVFKRLQLWGVVPDVVLLYVALQALQYGRVAGAVAGFGAGLLMDIVVGFPLGMNAMIKTVMGFVIGFFQSDQGDKMRIDPFQALIGALVVAVVHHGLLTILLALGEDTRNLFLIVGLWFGGALYTAVVALVASLFRSRS